MRDINTITLTGRLVHDPVLNRGASGGCLGHFVLASNRQCKDKNGVLQTETAFVPCKVFGGAKANGPSFGWANCSSFSSVPGGRLSPASPSGA